MAQAELRTAVTSSEMLRQICRNMSRVAAIVHYMERTGHKSADSRAMARCFGTWLGTIGDSVTFIQRQPFADKNKIFLLGHSLVRSSRCSRRRKTSA